MHITLLNIPFRPIFTDLARSIYSEMLCNISSNYNWISYVIYFPLFLQLEIFLEHILLEEAQLVKFVFSKSSLSIWHLLHNVKSKVKISKFFVAFLENMNFNRWIKRHTILSYEFCIIILLCTSYVELWRKGENTIFHTVPFHIVF